jgi:hypothetical protein
MLPSVATIGGGWNDALDRVLEFARGEFVFCVVAGYGDYNFSREIGGLAEIGFARRGQKLDLRLCGADYRRCHNGEKHCAKGEWSHGGAFETCQLRPP